MTVSEARPATAPGIPEADEVRLTALITQTLAGLKRSGDGVVYASALKRAILRKDPTFSEAEFGFRGFGELLAYLASRTVIQLSEGIAKGDPEVDFSLGESGEEQAFDLLQRVVHDIQTRKDTALLTGLKNEIRKHEPGFSEKQFGFGGFLQFCKAAKTRGYVDMDWDDEVGDYVLHVDKAAIAARE